jgi:hypothetical protein
MRGLVYTSVVAVMVAFLPNAMAGSGKCGESPCGSPCAAKASPCAATASPCSPCKVAKNPCEPKCKTVSGPCGECQTKCKMPKVDADIERLKAVVPECSQQLCVEYQVDIENMCGPYDLIIQVKNCDRIVYEKVVELENPYRVGDQGTENHYRGSFTDTLPEVFRHNSKFIVEGNVVPRGTRQSVDRERELVRKHDKDHGYATALYAAGDVLFTPVGWVTAPFSPRQ